MMTSFGTIFWLPFAVQIRCKLEGSVYTRVLFGHSFAASRSPKRKAEVDFQYPFWLPNRIRVHYPLRCQNTDVSVQLSLRVVAASHWRDRSICTCVYTCSKLLCSILHWGRPVAWLNSFLVNPFLDYRIQGYSDVGMFPWGTCVPEQNWSVNVIVIRVSQGQLFLLINCMYLCAWSAGRNGNQNAIYNRKTQLRYLMCIHVHLHEMYIYMKCTKQSQYRTLVQHIDCTDRGGVTKLKLSKCMVRISWRLSLPPLFLSGVNVLCSM